MSRFTEIEDDVEFDDDMDFDLPELPATTQPVAPRRMPQMTMPNGIDPSTINYVQDTTQFKGWMCLYPIYFDANRTVKHGRRLSKEDAVSNPLAKTIADAAKAAGFSIVFEPQKTHPADWANPGRVRVEFWDDKHRPTHRSIRTKNALLAHIGKYLRAHQTTFSDPHQVPVPDLPKDAKRAAIPLGAAINEIVPLHSPVMSGGGVDSEQLQNMMGGMFPGMASMMGDPNSSTSSPAPTSTAPTPPKKPKMKRQIIR